MLFVISIAQGMAFFFFSRSRQPDIPRFVWVVGEHRSIMSVMISSQSPLIFYQGGHQLFSWCSSLLTSLWQRRDWPGSRNQGSVLLQKTCILLSSRMRIIAQLWWLRRQCCSDTVGGYSRVGGLRQLAEGKDAVESWQGCGVRISI